MPILKPIVPYIRIAALVFLAAIALGFFGSLLFPQLIGQLFNSIFSMLEQLGREILQEQTPLRGTITLFLHNIRAAAGSTLFGAVLGIFPFISMVINGALLGVVFGFGASGRAPLLTIFAGILPHGIIEIPALIIAAGAGFYLGWAVFNKRIWPGYKVAGIQAAKAILLCAGMLFIAAIIEVNITPLVMNLVQ